MELIVHELGLTGDFGNTLLRQQFSVNKDTQLEAVRPHLYIEDNPAGSLFMEVQDNNGKTIATSNTLAISAINLSGASFFHGYVRFDLKLGLRKDVSYNMALKSTGYTYAANTLVGWCNDHDLRKATANVPSPRGASSPLDMELWARGQIIRG